MGFGDLGYDRRVSENRRFGTEIRSRRPGDAVRRPRSALGADRVQARKAMMEAEADAKRRMEFFKKIGELM